MKAEEIADQEYPTSIDTFNLNGHDEAEDLRIAFIKGYNYDKWIKCSEETPTNRESIMLFHKKYKQIQGYFETKDGVFWDNSSSLAFEIGSITHWQPLPNIPTEL